MSATPNPNQVMSTLRMLGDNELGQYAKMHKSDPYIFPLAFQESMMRKQMRSQGAAQPQGPGGAPPPPVNEQALASMQQLPESSGIARIAPPGVATMAAGGIVGFAGGGSNIENVYAVKAREDAEMAAGTRKEYTPGLLNIIAQKEGRPAEAAKAAQRYFREPDPSRFAGAPNALAPATAGPVDDSNPFAAENQRLAGAEQPFDRIVGSEQTAPAPKPRAGLGALGAGSGTSMSLSQSGGAAGAGTPGIPRMEAPAAPEKFASDKYFDERMAKPTVDPLEGQRKALTDADAAAAQRQYEGMKGVSAKQDALYDKQGAILDTRAADLGKEDKRNEAMAWITAGLEMIQAKGPGLAAIAGGAKKGVDFRAAGLEKIRTAQERIDDARVKVEESRIGSDKEKVGAQAALDKALNDGKKVMFGGLENAFNMKHSEAMNAVKMKADENMKSRELYNQWGISNNNNATTMAAAQLQSSTQLRAAEIQAAAQRASAGRNPQLELVEALSADPKKLATYRAMHAQGGGTTREQLYNKYITDFKKDPTDPNSVMMTPQQFTAVMDRVMGSAPAMTVTNDAPQAGALKRKD